MTGMKIPHTDQEIPGLILGTWVLGGDMWNGAKKQDGLAAVKTAIEQGITMIDTAPIYGAGVSEQIVGEAIQGQREKVIIATKCGLRGEGRKIRIDLSPRSVLEEVELSLKRLAVDVIDIYQCHWPDENIPIEKTMETLCRLKEQGKIRHIGVSNFGRELLARALTVTEVVTVQNQYSLLEREIEPEVLPFCREKNVGVITYGALAGGILTGKYEQPPAFAKSDARSFFYKYYQGEKFDQVRAALDQIRFWERPLNQVALNWARQQPGVTGVLVGCRNARQVQDNVLALDWELTATQLQELDQLFGKIV